MSNNTREQQLNKVFGTPTEADTDQLSFTATATEVELIADETYRMVATEDCYISFVASGVDVTTSGVLIIAGVPEMFSANDDLDWLSVIRKDTDGTLVVTKMTGTKGR